MRHVVHLLAASVAVTIACAAPAGAADFYAGKTIELVIGGDSGGGYDIYARALARHMVRHIPGNPTIVPKNMIGAGSGRAASYIFSVAPKDGTSFGAVFPSVIMSALLDERAETLFDPTKFIYIGTADSGVRVCAAYQNSKTKTYDDALKQKTVVGASAAGGSTRDYASFQKKLTGAKFDIISGYKGTVDIALAMERGEVDGICGWDWGSLKSQKADWIRNNKVNILVQAGLEPDPELTQRGVPELWKYVKDDETRKVIELIVSQQVFGRPYIAPPGTPPEQAKILRDAFDATMKDPDFLKDAERLRLNIEPSSGDKIQQLVQKLYASPKEIIARAKDAIKP
jgi:tripartite-type tricarboxylate transporter receptor subunit TctC